MSGVQSFNDARASLAEIIKSANAALVIGAGASVGSGAPASADLVKELRQKFPLARIPNDANLFESGDSVCFTPAYGRQDLIEYVTQRLSGLDPSQSYKQVPRVTWRAIFTTNYDDLVEAAYRSPSRAQNLQPFYLSDHLLAGRPDHLGLFYLMGSILRRYDEDGAPVVSWGDYHDAVVRRVPALAAIRNVLATNGKIVYVGYSFGDFILDGVLDQALKQIQPRNMTYGFAILKNWPADEQLHNRITTRKVIPVEGTFEDLADLIKDIADDVYSLPLQAPLPTSPAVGKSLTIDGTQITIPQGDVAVYSEMFEVLNDDLETSASLSQPEETAKKRAFLKGEDVGWMPFKEGWVFKGKPYETALSETLARCKKGRKQEPCVLLVHGAAALGKSVMARQLAYEVYVEHQRPVLLARPSWLARPDFTLVNRICDDLEGRLPPDQALPSLLLIIDEAELLDRSVPTRLAHYMRSKGRNVIILLFARTNEYFRRGRRNEESEPDRRLSFDLALSDQLSDDDLSALIQHIVELDIWGETRVTNLEFWRDIILTQHESSFFDTVYTLVELTQEPLKEHIWSEYQRLGELAKRAYGLIASTHQFGIPMKMEVLMRALAVPYGEFETEVIHRDAKDVLFSETQSSELSVFFRGRSKLISQSVFEREFKERHEQLKVFKSVIQATSPSQLFGVEELDALRTLLVQVLGPKGYDQRFSPEEQSELFEASEFEDDVLEHHHGLAERNAGRLLAACEHLERALELRELLPADLTMLRDSPQNIENSLAQVKGQLALEAIKRNDRQQADRLFEEARLHFLRARSGHFPNTAAYDAHARMLRERAFRLFKTGSPEQTAAFAEALQVVAEGVDNVNDEGRLALAELQTELMDALGFDDEAVANLLDLASKGPPKQRAEYLLIIARYYLSRRQEGPKGKDLKRALPFATKACELDEESFAAWRMRAEIYSGLQPTDFGEILKLVQKAQESAKNQDNCWISYHLAVAAFHLEKYQLAAESFRGLNRFSRGHQNRGGIQEVAGERGGGDPFEFQGRIVHGGARRDFRIRSDDLRVFGDVFFSRRAQEYYTPRLGDPVSFLVGFNYRGLIAVQVKRS